MHTSCESDVGLVLMAMQPLSLICVQTQKVPRIFGSVAIEIRNTPRKTTVSRLRCPDTNTKSIPTTNTKTKSVHPHTKTYHFRPAHKQDQFRPRTKKQVSFDPLHKKQSSFRPHPRKPVNFHLHSKNQSSSMSRQIQQVNFGHPHKNQDNSDGIPH